MRYIIAALITVASIVSIHAQSSTLTPVARLSRSNGLGYFEYLPENYDSRDDWPVLIVLHGLGRQGDGSVSSLESKLGNWGIVSWLKSNDVPFVILVPQDPSSNFTGTPTRINSFYGWARGAYAGKTTEFNWSVSYNSFSGGAFDEWSKENTDNFKSVAAHIPSASVISSNATVQQHENVANSGSSVWFHHSLADNTISFVPTRDFFRGIMSVVGSQNHAKYRYTMYQNVGHGTFNSVVFNDKGNTEAQETGDMGGGGFDYYNWTSGSFWDWLLAQDRNPVADETAPVLSLPTDEATGSFHGSGTVDTDEGNGTLYWVVTQAATTPSVSQIKSGLDHNGASVESTGSQGVSSVGTQNLTFGGLTFSTAYYAHYVHSDSKGNDSNPVSGDGFTTLPADYDYVVSSVSAGSPDFTWTLDGTIEEVNGHSTSSSGSLSFASAIIPQTGMQSWQSSGSASINPANSDLINTDNATEARAISLWFQPTNLSGWQNLYEEGGSTHGWHMALYDDYLTFGITQGGEARNSIQFQINSGILYHVVGVFDLADQSSGSNMELFVNGLSVGTANFDVKSNLDEHSGDVQFGGQGDGLALSSDFGSKTKADFEGRIQRIDYWSERLLGTQDAKNLYEEGSGETVSINPPTSLAISTTSMQDGLSGGSEIGIFDTDGDDPVTFALVSGSGDTDNSAFTINDNSLIIQQEVDYATQNVYAIRVEVRNGGGAHEESFELTVEEPFLAPSFILLSNSTIPDGASAGYVVGTLSADGTAAVQFSFSSGAGDADNSSFLIVGEELRLNENANFSSQNSYSILVEASNSEGAIDDVFTINVSPASPTNIALSTTAIADGAANGSVVATISSDGSTPLTYSLVSGIGDGDNASFSIVNTNQLVVNETVDAAAKSNYAIRLQAANETGTFSDSFSLTASASEKITLVVTANDANMRYGSALPPLTFSYKGFIDGDSESSLEQIPSSSSTASNESAVGQYEVLLSGGASDKYRFEYVSGTLFVEPSELAVTAGNAFMKQGQDLPEFVISYQGFKNSDNASSLISEPTPFTQATSESEPGTYAINIAGGESTNYNFTYQSGTLTISEPCDLALDLIFSQFNSTIDLEISGGSPPYGILWENGDESESIVVDGPGTYMVSVVDRENCSAERSIVIDGEGEVVLGGEAEVEALVIWPNPTADLINVQSVDIIDHINIYDLSGGDVLNRKVNSSELRLDLSSLNPGIYHLIVNDRYDSPLRLVIRD